MNIQNNQKILIHSKNVALDAIFSKNSSDSGMCCLLLPNHPMFGGTMNSSNTRLISDCFYSIGFTTLRLNFRNAASVGKQNRINCDMSDALDALDWLSTEDPECTSIWIAGFGYGADISIRAAMRRPNVDGFVSISPTFSSQLDFISLTPCPNGLIVSGCMDDAVDWRFCESMARNFVNQKGSSVKFAPMENADRNYTNCKEDLQNLITDYLVETMGIRGPSKMAAL